MSNVMDALKKAYKAQAIVKDTHSLKDYLLKESVKGVATMSVNAIESKYVRSQKLDSGDGFYTRFFLTNGETIGTFSNGAHLFFIFYANILGYTGDEHFVHIDIAGETAGEKGYIDIGVNVLPLDSNRSTYEFQLLGGDVAGFSDYRPDFSRLELSTPKDPDQPAEDPQTTSGDGDSDAANNKTEAAANTKTETASDTNPKK